MEKTSRSSGWPTMSRYADGEVASSRSNACRETPSSSAELSDCARECQGSLVMMSSSSASDAQVSAGCQSVQSPSGRYACHPRCAQQARTHACGHGEWAAFRAVR